MKACHSRAPRARVCIGVHDRVKGKGDQKGTIVLCEQVIVCVLLKAHRWVAILRLVDHGPPRPRVKKPVLGNYGDQGWKKPHFFQPMHWVFGFNAKRKPNLCE